jgi:hypothetical protein
MNNFDDIENQGRASTPQLPAELRARTLARCAQIVNQQNYKRRRRGWALIGTLAGVCTIHWLAISALNAQNNILMGGNNSNQTTVRFAMTPDEFHQLQKQRAEIMANSDIDYEGIYAR